MELRSSRRKNEYMELQITLNGMGVYEEGMELQEMRQVLDALHMSATEDETNFVNCSMQEALRDGELEFRPTQGSHILNSTMMSVHPNISPCSSPDALPEKIVVQAEVHHSLDWSPPNERFPRKRLACANIIAHNANVSAELEPNNEPLEPDAKRFHDACVRNATINNHEENSNNSAVNNGEISSRSLHEIHGPISERRVHDSGFIMGHETPCSSLNDTSANATPTSTASLNNSVRELSDIIHEVHGPVSVRRIHDSGVNISAELAYTSVVNAIENSNNSSENSLQISTSGASNPNKFDSNSGPAI